MTKSLQTKGYLIVASKKSSFYSMGMNLASSILDFNPDAKITFVTEERFLDGRERELDKVILCDDHYRAKLWGIANTPYDLTFYLDADMECVHEDISKVFDEIGDNDMVFTPLLKETDYAFRNRHFPKGSFELNGGCCLYKSTPEVINFINEWYEKYKTQLNDSWWPADESGHFDEVSYGKRHTMKYWDQFTLWWLTHESPLKDTVKIGIFEDWARWNYYSRYTKPHNKLPVVIIHHSGSIDKDKDIIAGI